MAVKLLSRNTRIENKSGVPLIVDVIEQPGKFLSKKKSLPEIPPDEHRYMCYADFGIENNIGRHVEVVVYFEDALEKDKKRISSSEIRDNEKIVLYCQNGTITYHPTKGNMIAMNGVFIVLKHAAKKIKSWLK